MTTRAGKIPQPHDFNPTTWKCRNCGVSIIGGSWTDCKPVVLTDTQKAVHRAVGILKKL